MNRNQNSRFAFNPTNIDISRSKFDMDSSVKLSGNVGDIIPFYCQEILPGDTAQIDTSKVIRFQTLITPMMDNIYLDTYFFFVPNRLVWQHWREFMGENTASAWIPQVTYQIPQLEAPSGGWNVGTIADYFGIPTGVSDISVNALPFRAYAMICSEWFRSENLSDPLVWSTGDATVTGVNSGTFVTDCAKGGLPYKAAKYFDYFTGALPAPQKGPDVSIPVAQLGDLPVVTKSEFSPYSSFTGATRYWYGTVSTSVPTYGIGVGDEQSANIYQTLVTSNPGKTSGALPANLWAKFDGTALASSINQLRMAFQIQKLYERDARGGTRYIEIIKSHFGVTSPDARMQRPEYLGGNRIPINVNQVVQSSETGVSPQGTVTAYSLTSDRHSEFTRSFTEHGFIIGLMVARYDHSYQQGIERFWSRKDRFDYYWPVFANIGEQAILNKEIYAQGSSAVDADGNPYDEQVFGYQEAWADYRYKPSRVAGEMRSAYAQSLDVWHLADDYAQMPYLSDSWIREDPANVDRVLAVTSANANQFWCDIFVKNQMTRPMPLYSIPGLIDHH